LRKMEFFNSHEIYQQSADDYGWCLMRDFATHAMLNTTV
jgi:hypothetical protein